MLKSQVTIKRLNSDFSASVNGGSTGANANNKPQPKKKEDYSKMLCNNLVG